jgi:hypothetical protein
LDEEVFALDIMFFLELEKSLSYQIFAIKFVKTGFISKHPVTLYR